MGPIIPLMKSPLWLGAVGLFLASGFFPPPAGAARAAVEGRGRGAAPSRTEQRALVPVAHHAVVETFLELGPLLGHVGPTEAKLWAKASGGARLGVRVGEQADLSDARDIEGAALESSCDFMGQMTLKELQPSQRYHYCILLDGRPAMVRPYPSFTTAPAAGEAGRVRFAFVSCVGYKGFDSAGAWADLATRTNFDLLLMLGDNHYGNTTDAAKHLEMFAVQRRLPGYAEISRRLPQYAIWDNHDYAPEPCDRTAKNKERTLAAFQSFWPNPAWGEPDNPGVYHKFARAGVEFFMLDGRYHRDPYSAPEETRTHLGAKQLAWLKRELLASKAAVKVLATGGEWQTFSQKASWTSFQREREELFKFIEEHHITGVLLLSGDRHFTAAYQVQGKFIEVTSGPMGSANSDSKPTPEMFFNGGRGKFYCLYDIDTTATTPSVTLEIYRASEGLVYRRPFTWEEVLGTTKIKTLPPAPAKVAEKANP